MSYICDICGKENQVGRSQKHKRGIAGKRWLKRAPVTPRMFKANLQDRAVVFDGKKKSMKLCTKCIKRIKNFGSVSGYKNISLA